MTHALDLHALARHTMIDAGFAPNFPPEVSDEIQAFMHGRDMDSQAMPPPRDLRSLLWSSIDNAESRDLDQVEFALKLPDASIRVLIGIADVDAFVSRGSAIDRFAAKNTTSVYTGVETFPMLPDELSSGLTSLLEDVDRRAVVVEIIVDKDGAVRSSDVYAATLRNHAKLSYESVGAWLDHQAAMPHAVARIEGLEAQIRLQVEAANRLRTLRRQNGALNFETPEATPIIRDGRVTDLAITERNSARDIIENFMIAANSTIATFLESNGVNSIRRVVREPERWPRIVEIADGLGETLPAEPDARALADFLAKRKAADPARFPDLSLAVIKLIGAGEYAVEQPGITPENEEGHFGLAVPDYTHATAPNRRYADLLTQRLVKAVIARNPAPYTLDELKNFAARCTERESAARKVARQMRKVASAVLLSHRIGEKFKAIVTGVTTKGTFVRTLAPPFDGRVVRGEAGLDVGDKVRVRLVHTNPERGFIDFARDE
ncbi:MAG: RNB domain-containing ribonuclease [Pyrinomonadaceae bacterium]